MKTIKQAAQAAGLPIKTLRYYDEIGLVAAAKNPQNNYREYSDSSIKELIFIKRCRHFDLSLDESRHLLALAKKPQRRSESVKTLVGEHLHDMRTKIAEMQALVSDLSSIHDACPGDAGSYCPILEHLESD